jgi:hypothetical protein
MKARCILYRKPICDYVQWGTVLSSKAYTTNMDVLTTQYRISYAGCSMFACAGFLITQSMSKWTPEIPCGIFLGKNAIDMQIESFMSVFIFRDKRSFHGILAVIKKTSF